MREEKKETKKEPEGYMENARGHLVPLELVKETDRLEDEFVRKVRAKADELLATLAEYWQWLEGEFEAFEELMLSDHGAKVGGEKGNASVTSYDGLVQVQRRVQDVKVFTESWEAAKRLIEECVAEWSRGSNEKLVAWVQGQLKPMANGKPSLARLMDMQRTEIPGQDERWGRVVEALRQAVRVGMSVVYWRVLERPRGGKWRTVLSDSALRGGGAQPNAGDPPAPRQKGGAE